MKHSLDFVVVGAQKSGTTSLFEYLRRHPEVYLPPGKEAPFFSDDAVWSDGWELYVRRHFSGADADQSWGTVTPHYMYGSLSDPADPAALDDVLQPERLVPERMAAHSPDARIVAILRDPVERAYSHYRMEVLREAETRSYPEAIDELLRPETLAQSRRRPVETSAYVTNGEFGRILAPYVDLFGRDGVLVCFAEQLAAEPAETLRRVLAFIGVDDGFRPPNLGRRYRVAGSQRRLRRLDLHRFERRVSSSRPVKAAWHALPGGIRKRIDRNFKELAYQVDVRNRVVEDAPARPMADVEERLRAHYASDRELLQSLVDTEIPW